MRTFFVTVSLIALFAAPALAGEGSISDRSLARMGLRGMRPISDAQGMSIRGTSFASISAQINVLGSIQMGSENLTGAGTISISFHNTVPGVAAASTSVSVTISHH
jgi:hypothetical protein